MDVFLIKATQLILALAFLIVIHEFGHFLFARIFGVKVEKFYIFFDPWTELFKWRPKKYIGFLGSHKWLKGASEEERKAYIKDKLERKAHSEWEAEKKRAEKEALKAEKKQKKADKEAKKAEKESAKADKEAENVHNS